MRRGGLKKPEGRSKRRRGALFKCHAISMKFVQEDAAKRAKETRDLAQEVGPETHRRRARPTKQRLGERLLATMHELAQSRDGWVLKNAISEGESVGSNGPRRP